MFLNPPKRLRGRLSAAGLSFATACFALFLAGQAMAQSLPNLTPGAERRAKATILIHGYKPFWLNRRDRFWETHPGQNCTTYWRDWRGALPQANATGIPVLTMALYRNSTGCGATLVGMADSEFRGGQGRNAYARGALDGSPRNDREWMDTQVPIMNLGYRLAWYIYNNYTVKGETVNLVGHSMGGLVARAAVGGTHSRLAGFPPRLLVNTMVTVATPNGGFFGGGICGSVNESLGQCDDMAPGSEFMTVLNAADVTHSGVAKRLQLRVEADLLSSHSVTPNDNRPATAGTNVTYWTPGRWAANSGDIDYLHGAPKADLRLDRTESMDWAVVNRRGIRTTGSNGQRGAPGRGTGGVPGTADGFYSLTVRRINQTTPDN